MILVFFLIVLVLCLLPTYKTPMILGDFISPEERQHIIKQAKERLSDSLVDTDGRIDKNVRQSRTAWLQKTDPVIRSVMERCVGYVNKTIDHCEQLQVLHYGTAVVTHVSGAAELAQRGIELTRQDLL